MRFLHDQIFLSGTERPKQSDYDFKIKYKLSILTTIAPPTMEKLIITSWGLWSCLGFRRGHQLYSMDHIKKLENNPKKIYYYTTNFGCCLAATFFYATPYLMPVTAVLEIYNLEAYIRGIKTDD